MLGHEARARFNDVGCLDDATVLDLVRGELGPDEMSRVDEHVDTCSGCREIVLATARTVGRDTPSLGAGDRVGRYVVESELGRGGFGVVYRASDPSLDRAVALKLVRAGVDETWRDRLHREAKAMARLSHPNVVTVYEVGVSGHSTFIAMELVDGEDLRSWLSSAPRSIDAICGVFVQAGEGLAAAHESELLHRDFKPDNVIVGRDGRVRVTDFGLARGIEDGSGILDLEALEQDELSASLTVTGVLLGTPAYMAPERLRGEAGDATSDQYSFCVSLYEALEGRRPFGGTTLKELRQKVLDGARETTESKVPAWLMRAVLRGLSPNPADRHPNMSALVATLRRSPASWWRRGVAVAAGLAAIATVGVVAARSEPTLCTGAGALADETWNEARAETLRKAFRASEAPRATMAFERAKASLDRWKEDWSQAHTGACEATRLRGEHSEQVLDARMACLDRQRMGVDALVAQLESVEASAVAQAGEAVAALDAPSICDDVASLSEVAAPPPEARSAVAEVERAVAEARAALSTGKLDDARRQSESAALRAAETHYDPVVARARGAAADAHRHLGRLNEAEVHANEGLWAARRARDWREEAQAWLRLATIAGVRGDYDEAEKACRNAEAVFSHLADAQLSGQLHATLGVVETHRGELERAAVHLSRALELRKKTFGDESLEVARIHTNLGNLARARGDRTLAQREHERAREIDRRLLGERHPNEARHRHNLARLRLENKDLDGARELYQSALALKRELYGDRHPEVASTHNSLGLLWARAGDHDAAIRHYTQALEGHGDDRPEETMMTRFNLGLALADAGRGSEARPHLERARRTAEEREYDHLVAKIDQALDEAEPKPTPPAQRPTTEGATKTPPAPTPPPPDPSAAGAYMPGRAWD